MMMNLTKMKRKIVQILKLILMKTFVSIAKVVLCLNNLESFFKTDEGKLICCDN